MPEFLISAAFAVLSVTAIGLAWAIARGGVLQHMMAAQLLGTGGTGAVLLLALAYETQAMVDVALVLVILASFSSVAFAIGARSADVPPTRQASDR